MVGVEERENRRIYSFVEHIEGTAVDKVEVEGDYRNSEKVYRIKYYPDVSIFKMPLEALKMLFGFAKPVLTERKYPESAIHKVSSSAGVPGAPEKQLVLTHDQHGNSPLLYEYFDEEDGVLAENVAKAERKAKKAEVERDVQEITSEENARDSKRKDELEFRKGKNSGSDDGGGDLF